MDAFNHWVHDAQRDTADVPDSQKSEACREPNEKPYDSADLEPTRNGRGTGASPNRKRQECRVPDRTHDNSPYQLGLSHRSQGQVRYRLKTAYRDGTTHIVLEPLDFIARLAALVPPPRVHLTRYHGVFAAIAAGSECDCIEAAICSA